MNAPDTDPLLLPHEAAERLGVSTKTLARYRITGLIDPVRLPTGRSYRYRTSAIDAILNGPPVDDPTQS